MTNRKLLQNVTCQQTAVFVLAAVRTSNIVRPERTHNIPKRHCQVVRKQSTATTVQLHICTTAQLYVCTTARLCNCTSVQLHICTTARLYNCTSVQLHICTTARLYNCTSVQLHIWGLPLRFRKTSKKNTLIGPLKTLYDIRPHPRTVSVEQPWLETARFQKSKCYTARCVINLFILWC